MGANSFIAPLSKKLTSEALSYGTSCQGITQFYLRTIPAFAFPVEAGTHLPTTEGWKAELASHTVAGQTVYRFIHVVIIFIVSKVAGLILGPPIRVLTGPDVD